MSIEKKIGLQNYMNFPYVWKGQKYGNYFFRNLWPQFRPHTYGLKWKNWFENELGPADSKLSLSVLKNKKINEIYFEILNWIWFILAKKDFSLLQTFSIFVTNVTEWSKYFFMSFKIVLIHQIFDRFSKNWKKNDNLARNFRSHFWHQV